MPCTRVGSLTVSSTTRISAARFLELSVAATQEMSGGTADQLSTRLFFNLLRVGNRLAKDFEVAVRSAAGMSFSGYQVLFTLRTVGPVNPNSLARLASVSTASMSSMLNTLERKGTIQRLPDPGDGRRTVVQLTEAGEELVEQLHAENTERERAWSQALSREEAELLDVLLRKMLNHRPTPPGATSTGTSAMDFWKRSE